MLVARPGGIGRRRWQASAMSHPCTAISTAPAAAIVRPASHRSAMLTGRSAPTEADVARSWPACPPGGPGRLDLQEPEPGEQSSVSIRKYVFSSTLDQAGWNNSTILRGDAAAEVTRLRQQDGPDLALFGHGPLAHTLLEHGLIDELRLSVHPVLAGHGRLLFWEAGKTPLELAGVRTLGTGVVVLSYRPAPA